MRGSEIAPRRARPSTKLRMRGYEEFRKKFSRVAQIFWRLPIRKKTHRGDTEGAENESKKVLCELCASAVNTSSQEIRNNPKGRGVREIWNGVLE
jgi:hypothetical protein